MNTDDEYKKTSRLEHEYIMAALNGGLSGLGALVATSALPAAELVQIVLHMGKQTYKTACSGEYEPPKPSVIHKVGS